MSHKNRREKIDMGDRVLFYVSDILYEDGQDKMNGYLASLDTAWFTFCTSDKMRQYINRLSAGEYLYKLCVREARGEREGVEISAKLTHRSSGRRLEYHSEFLSAQQIFKKSLTNQQRCDIM